MSGAGGPAVLALWSAPRSRSTAFLRMMMERDDRVVLHEPFSRTVDAGSTKVAGREVHDEAGLIAAITELAVREPVFFKDTTDFHYPGLLANQRFLELVTHTFIIRHPAEAIASHVRLNQDLRCDEIGFSRLTEIYDAALAATGRAPVVVDSDDLLDRPYDAVRAYCAAVGIPYLPEALSWQPGLREEWQSTRAWHESTSRTAGFVRPVERSNGTDGVHRDPKLAGYLRHHLPHYERLHALRLQV